MYYHCLSRALYFDICATTSTPSFHRNYDFNLLLLEHLAYLKSLLSDLHLTGGTWYDHPRCPSIFFIIISDDTNGLEPVLVALANIYFVIGVGCLTAATCSIA
jgi:hypothetical protein